MPIFHKYPYDNGYAHERFERVNTHGGERPRWLIAKYYLAQTIDVLIFFGSFMQYEGRYGENVLEQLICYREKYWFRMKEKKNDVLSR